MLNGNYDVVRNSVTKVIKIVKTHTVFSVCMFNDSEEGRAMMAGVKNAILFDGGTLFDVDNDEYVVGDISQLNKRGR